VSAREHRHTAEPRYTRREVLDVLPADGEALVLLANSRLARLSPIGWACYEALEVPATLGDLAAELERRFGPPPEGDALTAVTAVVEELVRAGVLAEVNPA